MGQFGYPHWEDDMTHNYTHDPSMSNHFGLPTTTHPKGKTFCTHKITQHVVTSNIIGAVYYR